MTRIDGIVCSVSSRFEVPRLELMGKSRSKTTSRARQAAMWLARNATTMSYPEVARAFNRKDHTTAMYACRAVDARAKADPEFAMVLADMLLEVA